VLFAMLLSLWRTAILPRSPGHQVQMTGDVTVKKAGTLSHAGMTAQTGRDARKTVVGMTVHARSRLTAEAGSRMTAQVGNPSQAAISAGGSLFPVLSTRIFTV